MSLIRIKDATAEPVTREEVKQHLRIESTEEDYLIDSFIKSARMEAEAYMRRQIMPATWRLTMQSFPPSTEAVVLPRPPLSSNSTAVVVRFYKDTTVFGDDTVMPSSEYYIDRQTDIGRIYPRAEFGYPSCVARGRLDAVRIDFECGYPNRESVPEPVKMWIRMKVGQYYGHREGYSLKNINPNRLEHEFFKGLLDRYVVIKI